MWTDIYGYQPLRDPFGTYAPGGVEYIDAHHDLMNRSLHYQVIQHDWERRHRMHDDQIEEDEIARRCLEAAHDDISVECP